MAATPFTGSKWGASGAAGTPGGVVTWSFDLAGASFYSFDGPIISEAYRGLVRSAFDAWERIAAIDFTEVANGPADVQVGLDAIDGRGGTLGEAIWSFRGPQIQRAEIAVDSAEIWSPFVPSGSNFYAVMVHEIGHAIGLGHSDDPTSIMYAYLGNQTSFSAADIAAVQTLYGPAGALGRTIYGTSASETLSGGAGNDTIVAGNGDDLVYGREGNDVVHGGEGNDTLTGNQNNDTVYGGFGNDLVYGGKNDDLVLGNQGDDTVTGNEGNDTVYGGLGNDLVYGGQGDDVVYGNQGRDTLHGGLANDTLLGGEDADLFQFGPSDGNDIIVDFRFAEGDRLSLGGQSYGVSDSGGSAVLSLSGGGTITLLGVTAAELESSALA